MTGKSVFYCVTGVILTGMVLCGPVTGQAAIQDRPDAGDLIWSDEFEGTGIPDPAKWERLEYNRRNNDNGPDGWWSNEDSYLDGNGHLVIRVRKIEDRNSDGDSCDFSSGMVRTKGKFEQLYGRFEVRCQLPTQPGWWVAFWMMQGQVSSEVNGGVDGTEVDIMEGFGWTDRVQNAFHWDGYGENHKSISNDYHVDGIREGFHTYAMEWYPEKYIFFIDGEEVWRSEGGGVCNQPGYIKLTGEISTESWAINSWWANHPANAVYPDSFLIDYVRVYEIGEYQPAVSIRPSNQNESARLVPNPAGDIARITMSESAHNGIWNVVLFDQMGRTVRFITEQELDSGIKLSGLKPGVYYLQLRSRGALERIRFMKM